MRTQRGQHRVMLNARVQCAMGVDGVRCDERQY